MKSGQSGKVTDELQQGLEWLVDHFNSAGPRVVDASSGLPPVIVLTDGACEESGTTIGGVMYIPGEAPQCFGAKLSEATTSPWKTKLEQTQVIGQAEIFPLLVARLTWSKQLTGRRVIYFIDNESARIGLVRAYSPVLPSLSIILDCLNWDYSHCSQGWYARVPSFSNISDGPSRLVKPSPESGIVTVAPIFPVGHIPEFVL